jgi:hypothetical protein
MGVQAFPESYLDFSPVEFSGCKGNKKFLHIMEANHFLHVKD